MSVNFCGLHQMAKVPNTVEILPKISTAWVGWTSVTDRQTTDDRRHHMANVNMSSRSLIVIVMQTNCIAVASNFVIHPQTLIFSMFKTPRLSRYWLRVKFSMSPFSYCFTFAINLWHWKLCCVPFKSWTRVHEFTTGEKAFHSCRELVNS